LRDELIKGFAEDSIDPECSGVLDEELKIAVRRRIAGWRST
jgi:hypothetical protein